MDTREAYNKWAAQYDTNGNRTRDLEGLALRKVLADIPFETCLEIGCGTGKNTEWLIQKAQKVTAVDLSEEMLEKAREKIQSEKILFQQADITKPWTFVKEEVDLITFSLVLEHIDNLEPVFEEVAKALKPGGKVYIGELHPFKQYTGTKARFDTEEGRQVLACFDHNLSDFIRIPEQHGLTLVDMDEYFDDDDRREIPRILTVLLKKG
ncbi:class I SAM-dependent DNA methyltransferase [Flavitalea flava]